MSKMDAEIEVLRQKIAELEKMKSAAIEEESTTLDKYYRAAKSPENIEFYLPTDNDYERMSDMNDDYNNISYSQFIKWNLNCIKGLSPEDFLWVKSLCRLIRSSKIRSMDLEHCSAFEVSGLYYNLEGNLCLTTPR